MYSTYLNNRGKCFTITICSGMQTFHNDMEQLGTILKCNKYPFLIYAITPFEIDCISQKGLILMFLKIYVLPVLQSWRNFAIIREFEISFV